MAPSDGGDRALDIFDNGRGPTKVGGKSIGRDLVAPRVLQASDALNGPGGPPNIVGGSWSR